jgi:fibrillarin-like pre-rRNA processing protein
MKEIFHGVWRDGKRFFTKSLVPGEKVFARNVIKSGGSEFREWDPRKSKASAAITNGIKSFPLKGGSKILYLGIASGSTSTFFSDIIGRDGIIYGIEISERSMRDLNPIAEKRGNIVPVLADARKPDDYAWIEKVDVVYQDVATDDQSEIMIRNSRKFLKKDGYAMIAIKARSIDVTRPPREIYRQELRKLRKAFNIVDKVELDPHEKDHLFVLMKPKAP